MTKKRFFLIFLFFVIYFALQFVLGWAMKGNMYNSFGRATLHDLHTAEKIENLLLGDCHLYSGLDVNKLTELTGETFITVATASQEVDGHLAILKETKKYHPELKRVYIDLDYLNNFVGDFKDRNHLRNIYTISDNLKDKKIKFEYLIHATSPKYYLNHILIFGKNRISGNPKEILNTIKSIINKEYWQYKPPVSGNQRYIKNGFIPSSDIPNSIIVKSYEQNYFDINTISADWYKTMELIFNFCKKIDIELSFFAVPETDFMIWDTINYNAYVDFLRNFVSENGFTYYDFNLAKNLDLIRTDFSDDEHLNFLGADKFTDCFYTFINTPINQRNSLFYSNLQEKKLSKTNSIEGFVKEVSKDGKSVTFKPVTNKKENIITYTCKINQNGVQTILQENSTNNIFSLPLSSYGVMNIQVYLNGTEYCNFDYTFNTQWIK